MEDFNPRFHLDSETDHHLEQGEPPPRLALQAFCVMAIFLICAVTGYALLD